MRTMREGALTELAEQFLAYEAKNYDSHMDAAVSVCGKLRVHLSKSVGSEGFRTLLARSLFLATVDFPVLGVLRVAADGALVVGDADGNASQFRSSLSLDRDATNAIVTQLFKLLATLIGDGLLLRIVGSVWPDVKFNDATASENENS
jgi:hypothetical protein